MTTEELRTRVSERCRAYTFAGAGCQFDAALYASADSVQPAAARGQFFALRGNETDEQLQEADRALDAMQQRDNWLARLQPLVDRLRDGSPDGDGLQTFKAIVRQGCQPDLVARSLQRYLQRNSWLDTDDFRRGERLDEQITKRLQEVGTLAKERLELAERDGVSTFFGRDFLEGLSAAAATARATPSISVERTSPYVSVAAVAANALLTLVDHIERVTGRPHYREVATIIGALRGRDFEEGSLEKAVSRARKERDELNAWFNDQVEAAQEKAEGSAAEGEARDVVLDREPRASDRNVLG